MSALASWIKDPGEITARSFALVRAETPLDHLPPALAEVAVRIVHACGMPDVAAELAHDGDVTGAAGAALAAGAPVLADGRMTVAGVIPARLPRDNAVLCTLDEARAEGTTRSAAALFACWNQPHVAVVLHL